MRAARKERNKLIARFLREGSSPTDAIRMADTVIEEKFKDRDLAEVLGIVPEWVFRFPKKQVASSVNEIKVIRRFRNQMIANLVLEGTPACDAIEIADGKTWDKYGDISFPLMKTVPDWVSDEAAADAETRRVNYARRQNRYAIKLRNELIRKMERTGITLEEATFNACRQVREENPELQINMDIFGIPPDYPHWKAFSELNVRVPGPDTPYKQLIEFVAKELVKNAHYARGHLAVKEARRIVREKLPPYFEVFDYANRPLVFKARRNKLIREELVANPNWSPHKATTEASIKLRDICETQRKNLQNAEPTAATKWIRDSVERAWGIETPRELLRRWRDDGI